MRVFQNFGLYSAYQHRFNSIAKDAETFQQRIDSFTSDGFGGAHRLLPPTQNKSEVFFTNADDSIAQRMWARENGMSKRVSLEDIFLAQIEQHRTEVFYNLDPVRFPSSFVKRLPGCVKKSIAWRAAPSGNVDFTSYDLMVCNFPSILESMRNDGCKTAYFTPAHDPLLDRFATNENRTIDIAFVGGYSRHHQRRGAILEEIAKASDRWKVVFYLNRSRSTRMAESAIGKLLPLRKYRRPDCIRAIAKDSLFGTDLFSILSKSKIVLNGAIDMAGNDRGNMRCFEAMGCRSLLLTDQGNYPRGMEHHRTMVTYTHPEKIVSSVDTILANWSQYQEIADQGYAMVASDYSKSCQWNAFVSLS